MTQNQEYKCSICGSCHPGPPLSWGPDFPEMWFGMPEEERNVRGDISSDQAVIDGKHFFIRGRIEIPVVDSDEPFAWLVWVEVSAEAFAQMNDLWEKEGREKVAPLYPAKVANHLHPYGTETLGLEARVHTRAVGYRPLFEIVGVHQLRDEQRTGISSARVEQIADLLLHS